MKKLIAQSALMLLVMTLITGIVYPLVVTGLSALLFPGAAQGSLIRRNGRLIGSALIGQPFEAAKYFWGRPSATTPQPYNGASSSGSDLGPTNPYQLSAVQARVAALQKADPLDTLPIPVDLVTASGSGLDPDISPAAAQYQVMRVAHARGLDPARVRALLDAHIHSRQWGVFGEPHVNVLELNLALDGLK